ncbi:MAG: hypothetical protein M1825_006084 [Sarcosagium campestre]|nr:MAG: hypothetical protein M1825_006084 [Sarcosagium campestre]
MDASGGYGDLAQPEYPDPDDLSNRPWLGRPTQPYGALSEDEDLPDANEDESSEDEDQEALTNSQNANEPRPLQGQRPIDRTAFDQSSDSDTDQEFYTLQDDVDRFQTNLSHQNHDRQAAGLSVDDPNWKKGGKRGRRGPLKPPEPPLEIKLLLSRANDAFINKDYDLVEEIATKVIQMDAGTYAAHAMLSGVFIERGEIQLGIIAQLSAAHLRPRNTGLWRKCVDLILENVADSGASFVKDAIYCCSRIIKHDPKDFEARYQRASLLREVGHVGRAAVELEQILKMVPEDTTVLKPLAEIYIDLGEAEKAKEHYRNRIASILENEDPSSGVLTWSDINIYVELFGYQEQFYEGLVELRRLSRWLLGRSEETYWDDFKDDDREWDSQDSPRRVACANFKPGLYPRTVYGDGLPVELRIKLGLYRLKLGREYVSESLRHFSWLDPMHNEAGAKVHDYQDLFRDAGDALMEAGSESEALKFYEPLQSIDGYADVDLYSRLGKCYRAVGLVPEAEQCFQFILENDDKNIDVRVQLARLYEQIGMPEKAFTYISQVLVLRQRDENRTRRGRQAGEARKRAQQRKLAGDPTRLTTASSGARPHYRKSHAMSAEEQAEREIAEDHAIQQHYHELKAIQGDMRAGDVAATNRWISMAGVMIEHFRSAKIFFQFDKYVRFLGYSAAARKRALKPWRYDTNEEVEAMADRLHASLEQEHGMQMAKAPTVPTDYRGIAFDDWLDIFLEYAMCLAKRGERRKSYSIIQAAYDCNVWYHSRDSCFLIHACWASCALYSGDDEAVCNISRWFMREYQFTSDSYRVFAALNRLCATRAAGSWYNSGPSQKFVLRQVKAMDYSLVPEGDRKQRFGEKASYTSKDERGQAYINDEMDVSLLMLYGHMLFYGTSYAYALNYFLRANALDPGNPIIHLTIGLSYMHYGMKRQSDNRQYLIMEGLAFLFSYYETRKKSDSRVEVQEAEFNVARAFHLLGLTHLALPYYERVFQLSDEMKSIDALGSYEDFAQDAAFNVQSIHTLAGNYALARQVTEKYLVI